MSAHDAAHVRAAGVLGLQGRARLMRGVALGTMIALALTEAACRTAGKGGVGTEQMLHKSDMVPGPAGDDLSRIPVSLWSPQQRQASATYYYLAAEYTALSERHSARALPLFEVAYGLDPNPFLGGRVLAARALAGQRPEALLEARKMVLLYPKDARLRHMYGELLATGGDAAAAIEQLERCIALDAKREACYLQLTELYHSSRQMARAIVVSRDLLKEVPNSLAGWAQLARLLLINNQPKDALIPARRAWEMQSNNPTLAQMYAIALQLNGMNKQAIRIYEQLYRMDPSDDELTARMIDLYRELGNLENALSLLDAIAQEESKGKPAVRMQKAFVLWELKRFQEASDLLATLSDEFPDSDRLRYLAGVGFERIEKFAEALASYSKVPEASPLKFQADFRSMIVLKAMKRHDEALSRSKVLLARPQADWEMYVIVANLYGDEKQYKEAIKVADDGYRRFSDKVRLLFLKGVYQERAGDRSDCVETMRQVIAKDPANSSAYNYLGYMFVEKGENLDEAEQLIKKALTLKPDDGFYLDSLGWLYVQKKDYQKALPILERASQIEPEEGVIFEHLGDLKELMGDKAAARSHFRRALEVNLDPKDRERVEKKLKTLGDS